MADKNSLSIQEATEKYPGEMFYQIQSEMVKVQGWPGHRNRSGRFGTDPLDTDFELAHMQGVIIRKLIIGQVFTTNPFYLLYMAFYGIVGVFPLIISIIETVQGRSMLLINTPFLLHELLGLSLIRNVIKSILFIFNPKQEGHRSIIIP